MKVAAIDIGTNTILCLIAEVSSANEITPLFEHTTTTRLGNFSQNKKNELNREAVSHSLDVLGRYKKLFVEFQVEETVIVATSVLREAKDRAFFCNLVEAEIGFPVHVSTEVQEAELSYVGALSNKKYLDSPVLVVDIGGGSMELILGKPGNVVISESIPVGAVKLTRHFPLSEPPASREISQMRQHLNPFFTQVQSDFRGFKHLIGVGGTVTTLAALNAVFADYDPEQIDGTILDLSAIKMILKRLKSVTLAERKKIIGLPPERADIIISGTVLLIELIEWLNAEKIIVSHRCLRYGAILKMILSEPTTKKRPETYGNIL